MSTATTELIETSRIFPPHPAHETAKLAALVASMQAEGWQGRPLLVLEIAEGFLALTGSHRYAAARKAGLEEIPCVLASIDHATFEAEYGPIIGMDDEDLLSALREAGDEAAATLMAEEIAAN